MTRYRRLRCPYCGRPGDGTPCDPYCPVPEQTPTPGQMACEHTPRGFVRYTFYDLFDEACSVQESSLATEAALWLGAEHGTHPLEGGCLARMHLSQALVQALLPLLQHFADYGTLPRREDDDA